jgi:hypothetical protein
VLLDYRRKERRGINGHSVLLVVRHTDDQV